METVMPSLSTSPAHQCKQGDHPSFAAKPLPAQARPTSGMGMMLAKVDKTTPKADQYDSLFREIQDSIKDKDRWKGSIKLKDGDGNDVDPCDWLGKESPKSRGSVLILSDEFGKSDADAVRDRIIAIAKDECVILRAKLDNTKREPRIKFRCYRNALRATDADATST